VTRLIKCATLLALLAITVHPARAGILATDPAAYTDLTPTVWHGTTSFANVSLVGYVDWAVYAPGHFPGGFGGYVPTPGEGTYAYQVFVTGAAPLSSFKLAIQVPAPADNIGAFSGGGVVGDAPTSESFSGLPDTANWNFAGILAGNSSEGLAFSSPVAPRDFFGSVIDTGQFTFVLPLPSPAVVGGKPGGPFIPEPSTLVLAGCGFAVLATGRFLQRRKVPSCTSAGS
jgi:hypothetical protein